MILIMSWKLLLFILYARMINIKKLQLYILQLYYIYISLLYLYNEDHVSWKVSNYEVNIFSFIYNHQIFILFLIYNHCNLIFKILFIYRNLFMIEKKRISCLQITVTG